MKPYRVDIPQHVAEFIRRLQAELKQRIRAALRTLATQPGRGEALKRDFSEYRKYRVGRFRIVYAPDSRDRVVRLLAVGQRRRIYEEMAELVRVK